MTKEELKNRTKKFHIAVIKACEQLPKNATGFELAKQLIRSAGRWELIIERLAGKVNSRLYL